MAPSSSSMSLHRRFDYFSVPSLSSHFAINPAFAPSPTLFCCRTACRVACHCACVLVWGRKRFLRINDDDENWKDDISSGKFPGDWCWSCPLSSVFYIRFVCISSPQRLYRISHTIRTHARDILAKNCQRPGQASVGRMAIARLCAHSRIPPFRWMTRTSFLFPTVSILLLSSADAQLAVNNAHTHKTACIWRADTKQKVFSFVCTLAALQAHQTPKWWWMTVGRPNRFVYETKKIKKHHLNAM